MKQLLLQYSTYNFWANNIITEKISTLPLDIIEKEMGSSFGSIYKTVVHLMDVESIWWQRLKLQEHVAWPGKTFTGNFEALSKELLALSRQWNEWVSEVSDMQIDHVFGYQNSKK